MRRKNTKEISVLCCCVFSLFPLFRAFITLHCKQRNKGHTTKHRGTKTVNLKGKCNGGMQWKLSYNNDLFHRYISPIKITLVLFPTFVLLYPGFCFCVSGLFYNGMKQSGIEA